MVMKKNKNHYIANPLTTQILKMETNFREKQKKSYEIARMAKDITMAILILSMAVLMFFSEQLKVEQIADLDKLFRYFFGGLCLLYGGFRLYRGVKRDY